MSKAFAAFDKDGIGFIDISELRLISKDLGHGFDNSELDECMKDLDINANNKISYEEFSQWWLSGSGVNLTKDAKSKGIGKFPKHLRVVLKKIQDDLKFDQSIEFNMRLKASPKDILIPGSEPVIKQLLKGLGVSVRINAWRKISDILLKVIESEKIPIKNLPIIGGISPLFILRVNGHLDFTIDDTTISELENNPLIAPLLMDAESLIAATSEVDEPENIFDYINSRKMPEGC